MSAALEVRHQPERNRFTAAIGSSEGYVEYRRRGSDVLDLTYTFVPREARGGGVGRELVLHVLEHARREGLGVVPTCGFVRTVIEENPRFADLVAPPGRR
jgi:predicted GNAT family acetyltransferase